VQNARQEFPVQLIRHLFTATDFSHASRLAVDRGLALASGIGARCTVLHALGLDALGSLREMLGEEAAPVAARVLEQARARLQELVADAARDHGVVPELLVEEGVATAVVPRRAVELDADLVVVGSRGESNLRRLLIGSTTSRLLRKSRCPVLVVKTAWQGAYRRALVAVDFSPASVLALRLVRELAPGAHLQLLHIFEVPQEGLLQTAGVAPEVIHGYRHQARQRALQQLHELVAAAGLDRNRCTVSVDHGDAAGAILERSRHQHNELVVMGKHGTHVTEELLLGSVTRRVLSECVADVLVVVDKQLPPAQE
jgi:CPA2 family monovalent cation:H+ antiporter-2